VTVAALAFGLLRLIFSSFVLSIHYFYKTEFSIPDDKGQKNSAYHLPRFHTGIIVLRKQTMRGTFGNTARWKK
jgi:hypothetical protein